MTPHILSTELNGQFGVLRDLLQRSVWLAERCADFEATQILRARLTNLQSAALLVIVGEVKAGKSSFVNALVREDVCEVAPGPCTTAIRELVYGAERQAVSLGQSWDRVYLPKEVLREISIVDTPGTNSIVQNHEAITETYIPQSDLVVFVFSAVNPHTKSAWEFLKLISKEWHRKMVFVLQQADRASEKELRINREHVRQYALERQVEEPTIFTLSAKGEMESASESGFGPFRDYLGQAVACGDVWRMKVEGSYETIRAVIAKLLAHARSEQEAIAEERAFYSRLLQKVEAHESTAAGLRGDVLNKISAVYDDMAKRSEDDFVESLGFANLLRGLFSFRRDTGADRESAGKRAAARKQIGTEARLISKNISGEMQAMLNELAESIAQRQASMREKAFLPLNAGSLKALEHLRAKLERIRLGDEIARHYAAETTDVTRLALAGSGLALLGIIVTAFAQNLLFVLTGVILAVVGILLIGAGLLWRRSDLLRDFRERLRRNQKEFRARLDSEFAQVFDGLFYEVRQALAESIFRLDFQATNLAPIADETFRVGEAASELLLRFQGGVASS